MNMAIAFFAGCITFVLMMGIKIPLKKIIFGLTDRMILEKEAQYVFYKRCNVVIILVTMLVAIICEYIVLQVLQVPYFKLCYCMKAGAIAVALYAAYEQWFGES